MTRSPTLDETTRARVRELLAERGETAYAVSRRVGKHPSWLANLLGRTDRSWRLATLAAVAEALDCEVEVTFFRRR